VALHDACLTTTLGAVSLDAEGFPPLGATTKTMGKNAMVTMLLIENASTLLLMIKDHQLLLLLT